MLIAIIVGVLAISALIGFAAWRFIKSTEALQANPAKLRRRFLLLAVLYGFGITTGIMRVLAGEAPPFSLVGMPIAFYFVWWYLKSAARLKNDSK